MAPLSGRYIDGSKVVSTFSGPGTGDFGYRTADGRCWQNLSLRDIKAGGGTVDVIRRVESRREVSRSN